MVKPVCVCHEIQAMLQEDTSGLALLSNNTLFLDLLSNFLVLVCDVEPVSKLLSGIFKVAT